MARAPTSAIVGLMTSRHPRTSALLTALASFLLIACDGGTRPGSDARVDEVDAGPMGCGTPSFMCAFEEATGSLPLDLRGRTDDATDDFGGSACGADMGGMGGTGAPDIAFAFTASEAGTYEFNTVGSPFDTLISIRSDCAGEELACNDDVSGMVRQSSVEVDLTACQTVLVIVDGYGPDESGNVVVNVVAHEGLCGDGVDNDGDGLLDCDDDDCFSLECSGGDDWPVEWQTFEWDVLRLTNEARAAGHNCDTEGVFGPAGPLEMDAVIQVAARGHALDMGEQNYFMHDSLDGRSFSDRMRNAGFMGGFPWGENIATGQTSAEVVVEGWLESDGHCANIMNPAYNVIGIGYAFVATSRFGHQWVQDFAGSH